MKTLSIITVHKGDYKKLHVTLNSIRATFEGVEEVESIIIDASPISEPIPTSWMIMNTKLIQEVDKGIFDGMNKGFAFANGQYTLFLNSGDQILTTFSNEEIKSFLLQAEADWYSLPVFLELPNGSLRIWQDPNPLKNYFGLNSYCHQSQIVSKNAMALIGSFDIMNRAADWVFFIKLGTFYRPKKIDLFEIHCEPFDYSQKYSLLGWAVDVAKGRIQALDVLFWKKPFHYLAQLLLALLLSIRKFFIKRNFK